jgi:hypothetical protein
MSRGSVAAFAKYTVFNIGLEGDSSIVPKLLFGPREPAGAQEEMRDWPLVESDVLAEVLPVSGS